LDYYIVFRASRIKDLVFRPIQAYEMPNRKLELTIVPDCTALTGEIAAITQAAFARQFGSGESEVALISALRAEGTVVAEFAALEGDQLVGHALFSRLAVDPPMRRLAALAPVCARIDRQRRGVGAALIRVGLHVCRDKGFDGVAVLGDPAYYERFGFKRETAHALQSVYSGSHFQALELRDGALAGGPWRVTYPKAFG
jgi:putative acetyltransferase